MFLISYPSLLKKYFCKEQICSSEIEAFCHVLGPRYIIDIPVLLSALGFRNLSLGFVCILILELILEELDLFLFAGIPFSICDSPI